MKKIIGIVIGICSFFMCLGFVKAETFVEGSFISGEYVNKVKNNKTYYMTMQFIRDSHGRIVYCLEPFVDFKTGQSYTEYTGDLTEYSSLSKEQKRRIELIIYYGYGYGYRTQEKWYVITQYLIWKEIDPTANIYFTSTLNGKKLDKYETEINELLFDVNNHDIVPSFVHDYELNYKDTLEINELNNDYVVVNSDYDYVKDSNGFKVDSLSKSGIIKIKKNSNYYEGMVVIFDSKTSQDLIRPGNVNNIEYLINVNVKKGDITLDIKDDDSVYTIESDFSNTCYEVIDSANITIDKVCTKDEGLIYKTIDLAYGDYTVVQTSYGIGYKADEKVYKVSVNSSNEHPVVNLYNQLIKNEIEILKYACKNDVCGFEKNAMFEVKDIKGNVVSRIATKENGYTSLVVGYGSYYVSQIKGNDGYTLAEDYKEKIVDEVSPHKKELYNYFIEVEIEEKIEEEIIPEAPVEEEIVELPPATNTDYEFGNLLISLIIILGLFFGKVMI